MAPLSASKTVRVGVGVCGVQNENTVLYDSANSPNNPAMEMDLTMDTTYAASTNEVFSLASPCSIFNNDESDLISEAWNIAETKAECTDVWDVKNTLETPDIFKDLGPDLGFGSWPNSDLGISLDDPFFETFTSVGDECPLDLFPDVLPLSDTSCSTSMAVPTEEVSGLDDVCGRYVENTLVSDTSDAIGSLSSESTLADNIRAVTDSLVSGCEIPTAYSSGKSEDALEAELEAFTIPTVEAVDDSVEVEKSLHVYNLEILNESSVVNTVQNSSSDLFLLDVEKLDLSMLPDLNEVTSSTVEQSDFSLPTSEEDVRVEITPVLDVVNPSVTKRKRSTVDDVCSSEQKSKQIKLENIADKQTLRRIKNNIASRHSRASRKNREKDLCETADRLEIENSELRKQVEELSKQTELLRKVLVERLSGCGN